jgi:HD-GYP domain-containing protein (c-di-GMP phosphodiesterase class II)
MNAPAKFLTSLAQSLSTMMLYPREHPTWKRAADASFAALQELQKENAHPVFSFIGRDIVYGESPLHDLKDWPWAQKLAEVGVGRLEFEAEVRNDEFEEFIADVLARIVQSGAGAPVVPATRSPGGRQSIRFGAVTVREIDDGNADLGSGTREPTPAGGMEGTGLPYGLEEEASGATWIYEQVQAKDVVPLVEADAVVRSLTVAMRGSSAMIIPLLRLKASDPYNAIHAINVAVLVMALAESLGLGNKDVHEFGMAALLHDLGMAKVPRELVTKPIELTDEERKIVERHPADGARIILQSDKRMELGATVAYEHHLRPDGSGYPQGLFRRPMHFGSKMVRVCSVYNALRIERAHRQPYPAAQALLFIDERAGKEFDAEVARAFTGMMRRLEPQITEVTRDDQFVTPPVGAPIIPAGAGDY